MQNTTNYARNFAKYMLPQHIWNLQYIWTYPGCWGCLHALKLFNYLKKHPKSSRCSWINVTKKWAMVTMLKALPLVHFSNALLLRERIKISVEIKQIANRLIYFFLASPNKLFNLLSFVRKTRSKCTIFPFCGRFLVSLLIAAYCGLQTLQIIETFLKNAHTSVKTTTRDFFAELSKKTIAVCSAHVTLSWTTQEVAN